MNWNEIVAELLSFRTLCELVALMFVIVAFALVVP